MRQQLKKTITISFPVEIWSNADIDVPLGDLGADLERDSWEDGRYPFHHEMLVMALSTMLEGSLREKIQQHMTDRYGNEMVVSKTENSRSETSKAYLEACAWFDKYKPTVHVLHSDWLVKTEDR